MGGQARQRFLSSRGRQEFKRAKAGGSNSALFEGRVGGKLRGELRLSPITYRAGTMWIYVQSPTAYGPYQEFGTRHHRAQPFLRPALYESRKVLRSEVDKVAKGKTLTPAGGAD